MTLDPIGNELDPPEFPVELRKIRVIEYFEGERLVEYRSKGNDPFFKVWLDTDGRRLTRWLFLRLTDRDVARFLHLDISLREVIVGARDRYVYVVDKKGADIHRLAFLWVKNFPPDLLPLEDSYYDSSLSPQCTSNAPEIQDILLDGQWDGESLAEFEKRYFQVSGFVGHFANGSKKAIQGMQGRFAQKVFAGSGWAHVNAVDEIVKFIPQNERPLFQSVQLSSPGILKYRIDGDIAAHVSETMRLFKLRGDDLKRKYDILHEQLINVNRDARSQAAKEFDRKSYEYRTEIWKILRVPNEAIREAAKALAEALNIDPKRMFSVGGTDVNSGEMIAGFYRRALQLFGKEKAGSAIIV